MTDEENSDWLLRLDVRGRLDVVAEAGLVYKLPNVEVARAK